jgi:SpoVK/Ycf46/Vps4 family AAA+-type ATPase
MIKERVMSGKGKWEKHGSPYDPSHKGNNRTKTQADKEAVSGLEPSLTASGLDLGFGDILDSVMFDAYVSHARGGNRFTAFRAVHQIPRDMDSAAYNAAKQKVEQWLKVAPDQAFDDIIGNDEALAQLKDAIEAPVKHKELYERYGMKMPKGALLSGPPGCGKTMFARAAASTMKKLYGGTGEFVLISGNELQSPYIGKTEEYIKSIFNFGKLYKKTHGHSLLVFIDEAEAFVPDRTGRTRQVYGYEQAVVSTLLAEMDGVEESGVFLMLASNRPQEIDEALLRDGRCDFKIIVKRPSVEAVETILRNNFKDVFTSEPHGQLVFAAIECLLDPNKVIKDIHAVKAELKSTGVDFKDMKNRHFCLEHILSGAMAVSIPERAKRFAFARDKTSGKKPTGVTTADVVNAVNALFESEKGLEHSFALNEFCDELLRDAKEEYEQDKRD